MPFVCLYNIFCYVNILILTSLLLNIKIRHTYFNASHQLSNLAFTDLGQMRLIILQQLNKYFFVKIKCSMKVFTKSILW